MKNPVLLRTAIAGAIFSLTQFFSCSPASPSEKQTQKSDSLLLPKITMLANLPDSLKPKTTSINVAPQTIPVPTKKGGHISFSLLDNQKNEIELEPAEVIFLPSLTSNDNAFILGEAGGKSPMQTFTTDDGLVLDAICHGAGFCDSKGNLWFGTEGGGVSRYDGKSFTNFTTGQGLANNIVETIAEDHAGNIWFGTFGEGASRYDGKSFTKFTTAQGLADNTVLCIKPDSKGNIWFGTKDGGVSRYDGKTFTNYTAEQGLAKNLILNIAEDHAGNMWFCTYGGGVSRYDASLSAHAGTDGNDSAGQGKTFTNFTTKEGLAHNVVFGSAVDKAGNIWFGTGGGGVSCYNGKTFTNYTTADGLAKNYILNVAADNAGNIWFATYDGGVSRYDVSLKTFTSFTTAQGLANNTVESVTADKTGNVWFGTAGGGVSRYDGKSFANYTTDQGLANNAVQSIAEDRAGNRWFGTQGSGASCYNGKSFTNYTTAQGLGNDVVMSITRDHKGDLWFGTSGGVSYFDDKSFTNYSTDQGLADNSVMCMTEDHKGNFWIGTYGGGVSYFDGKSFTNYSSAQGLAGDAVFSILEDKSGNVWFGTEGGGVSRFDASLSARASTDGNGSVGQGKSFTNYTVEQGLANNNVFCITEDSKGNIWFGTYGGGISLIGANELAAINKNNTDKNQKLFETFNKTDGLVDDGVTQIIEGENGIMYVGTNFGVCELVPSAGSPKGWVTGRIFNSATGYPVKDVNTGQNALFKDSKGIIWIGTGSDKSGLVRFDPAALNVDKASPVVVLQSIRINDEALCWNNLASKNSPASKKDSAVFPANITEEINTFGHILTQAQRDTMLLHFGDVQFDSISKWYPVPQHLVLPYSHNNVTFEFNAVDPGRHFMVRYQHMLEGYDKDWSPVTENSSASFGNIDEGTYTFRVKARSPEGVWSEPISYTFTVLPPWWRTWWMYTLYAIAAVLLVTGIVKWNGRRLKAKADELAEEVEKATLVIRDQKEIVEHQKRIVEEKNKDITDSINYAKRIQQAKLPKKEEVTALLPQSFVLFKPKAIVSGDFYFVQKKNDLVFIAAADCTGHGVPGALMSMIGSEKLAEAVTQTSDTAEILAHLNRGMRTSLRQSDSDESTRDGMDIVLCAVNIKNGTVSYTGANRPIWIQRRGQAEMEEIKATKKAIGGLTENEQQFDRHEIKLQPGDTFYIFSDGYADTFSGRDSKKLTTKRFKDMLIEIREKPMAEQDRYLDDFIERWKEGTEQVDDILVIGVRV